MKDWKLIKFVLLFLLFYLIVLGVNIREELGVIIKVIINKGEGILVKVDMVFIKKWKFKGMKFRWYWSIKGVNDYKLFDEKWGIYYVFDIVVIFGIWYEYKVEVKGKGSMVFFLFFVVFVIGYWLFSIIKVIVVIFNMVEFY